VNNNQLCLSNTAISWNTAECHGASAFRIGSGFGSSGYI